MIQHSPISYRHHLAALFRLALLPALALAATATGWSQDAAPAETEAPAEEPATPEMSSQGKKLTPHEQAKAENLFREAYKLFLEEKFEASLAKLNELNELAPKNSSVMNLIGAIKTKQGKFDEAIAAFEKAAEFAPDDFRPRFNIAEVSFLKKDYPKAREGFKKLVAEDKGNELAAYKVYLTYLLEGNNAMAELQIKEFDEFSDWPTYYFANAAKSFNGGNVEEGQDWIISARKIYPGGRNALYAETLLDLGWIKQEHYDRIKVTAREAVIDFKQPLRVPKDIAKELGMMPKPKQGGRKKLDDPTEVKANPFKASKADVDLENGQ